MSRPMASMTNRYHSIYDRAISVGEYFSFNNTTIRKTAKAFGVSKSTIAKDLARLETYRLSLWTCCRAVIANNLAYRAIRGGLAVKAKYSKK